MDTFFVAPLSFFERYLLLNEAPAVAGLVSTAQKKVSKFLADVVFQIFLLPVNYPEAF